MLAIGAAETARRERVEFLAWALADFQRFCGLLEIQPKSGGGRIRFALSPIQRAYCAARTPRDIILKPRQVFITTLECARDAWRFLTVRGARVVIVCQSSTDQSAFKDISYKFRLFFDSLRRAGLKLDFHTESAGEWAIASRDATMRIIQAGASDAAAAKKGRGGTVNRLHITESAFFEHAEVTFNSLLESVPGPEHSEVVNESTPNGATGFYFQQWHAAQNGENGYVGHFFRWWDHPEYRTPLDADEVIVPASDMERALLARGVTPEQLKWYRRKVSEKGPALASQEYPSDPDTCFLVSGRTFFDQATTTALINAATAPIEREDRERIAIWKAPQKGRRYLISADTAEGGGGDPSGALVYDRESGEHVATISGQYQPWELAGALDRLGRRYNAADVVVERNNHGHAVLQALEREYHYPKIYKHEDDKLGWPTNIVTRPVVLDALEDSHRRGLWKSPDRAVLSQLRTFIVTDTGKAEAARGEHDDLVIAAAIGWAARAKPVSFYGPVTW